MTGIITCRYCGRKIRFEENEYDPTDIPLFKDENNNLMCRECYAETRKPKKEEIKKIISEMKRNGEI